MNKEFQKLIPEIDQINDAELADKVSNAFDEARRDGGWSWEELSQMPFTLLLADSPIDFITHTRGVTRCAIAIYDTMTEQYSGIEPLDANRDILIAGAILHDVGKMLEYRKDGKATIKSSHGKYVRHPFSGVGVAARADLPPEVLHIIAVHSHEGDKGKRSVEAIILHHADFCNFEPFYKEKCI